MACLMNRRNTSLSEVLGTELKNNLMFVHCFCSKLFFIFFSPEVYLWSLSLTSIMIFIISQEEKEVCFKNKY